MNFALTHEQRMLVRTIKEFIKAELQPHENEVEETGILNQEKALEIQQKSIKFNKLQHNSTNFNRITKCTKIIKSNQS